jgi:hypothetical protein
MYGSLCVVCGIAAMVYLFEFRAHRARAARGERLWRWHGSFLMCMVAGFLTSMLKLAFYCAYKWQQKAPELLSAPKTSRMASSLSSQMWTMYAMYRVFKPLCFASTLAAKVLILTRMLSLISIGRSSRARRFVARVELGMALFAAASSLVACIIMFGSSEQSFAAAAAFALAADSAGNATVAAEALVIARTRSDSSNVWNSANNSFEVGFYFAYLAACISITVAVFRTMRDMLQNIQAQKLLLDDLSPTVASVGEHVQLQDIAVVQAGTASRQTIDRLQTEQMRLHSINDAADQKLQRLRDVLRRISLNCVVIVTTTLFGSLFLAMSAAQGLLPSTPPPPCAAAAGACDACELQRNTRHTSHLTPHTSHLTPHTSHLTPHTSHLTPHTSHLTLCMHITVSRSSHACHTSPLTLFPTLSSRVTLCLHVTHRRGCC